MIFYTIIISCKHADKAEFAMKVIKNPENIEYYLNNANFSSNIYRNYFNNHKEYCIKELMKAQVLCQDKCEIFFAGTLNLHPDVYNIEVRDNENIEIDFYWRLINEKWDLSGINVRERDTTWKFENRINK